jgi:Tfp pilus assembly protein PilV
MRDTGLTLLELTLAMCVFAFGVLSLLCFLVNLGGLAEDTTHRLCSALCAQEKMEELKFMLTTRTGNTLQGEESLENPCGSLRRSWMIGDFPDAGDVKEIEVQCEYLWRGKKKGTVLRSLLAP